MIITHPQRAFRAGPLTIRETVYGIVKRLQFFLRCIGIECKSRQLNPSQVRVLDVGCGTGVNVTIPLAEAGYSVVGLDIHAPSIERAQQLAAGLQTIEFRCGALEQQCFDQDFHIVICSEVLEHIQRPHELLEAISKVLCDEGLLLVTVPNGLGYYELESVLWRSIQRHPAIERALYTMEDRFWRVFASKEIGSRRSQEYEPERLKLTQSTLNPDEKHYQSFWLSSIVRLLETHGFKVIRRQNGTLMGGNLVGLIARECDVFLSWNADATDVLPRFLSCNWFICSRLSKSRSAS